MLTYRTKLKLRSATLSPWHADTLFGHLCWLIRYQEGEAALKDFLAAYQEGQPPMLYSNGFPGDFLPRPILPARGDGDRKNKETQVAALQNAKEGKGIHWVDLDNFSRLRRGEKVTLEPPPRMRESRVELKNQINRLTGTTTGPEIEEGAGNLYSVEELAYVDRSGIQLTGLDISIYIKVTDEDQADRAEALLRELSRSGYGAKKSAGYGQFELIQWERFTGFDETPEGANGFISLSHWVPAKNDPTEGYYASFVKYGKLGEELASSENPFKFPLIMLKAGSAFHADPPIHEWYGRMVPGAAPGALEVVQYGYAFAVPAVLHEE